MGQASYAARALLFTGQCHLLCVGVKPVSSLVGLPTENGEGSIVEVFPSIGIRYHCAHLEKIPQAHMQIPRLYLVDGICSCQSEASPPFLYDTVTLMAILLCCTPRRESYRIQHSDNWCLVRIRLNWCRCLNLGCLQETMLGLGIKERVPGTESVMKA